MSGRAGSRHHSLSALSLVTPLSHPWFGSDPLFPLSGPKAGSSPFSFKMKPKWHIWNPTSQPWNVGLAMCWRQTAAAEMAPNPGGTLGTTPGCLSMSSNKSKLPFRRPHPGRGSAARGTALGSPEPSLWSSSPFPLHSCLHDIAEPWETAEDTSLLTLSPGGPGTQHVRLFS